MTLEVIGGHALFVPLTRYKGREVRLRNPNHPPDPVCNKEPVVNPAPYRAGRDVQTICNVADGEKARRGWHGHSTPKNRSSDGTLINLRAPIFVHSISSLFILL
jgi:hypothetical protein